MTDKHAQSTNYSDKNCNNNMSNRPFISGLHNQRSVR